MYLDPWNPNQKNDRYDRSNLFVNITILALTIGILDLSYKNIFLNAQNVRLNTRNVELNTQREARQPAEHRQRDEALKILKEINNKI